MAKKKRQPPHEEHEGEPWLLPYSDLMTLLLALFIALFAISQTDQTKLKQMAQAFTAAFNSGGPSFFDAMGPNPGRRAEMPSDEDAGNSAYIQENQSLEEVQRQMEEYIEANNLKDKLTTELSEDGWSYYFDSVIVFGRLEPVRDHNRALEISRQVSYKFTGDKEYIEWEVAHSGAKVLCFALIPEHISGKRVHEK